MSSYGDLRGVMGAGIRAMRKQRGMSQAALAAAIGLEPKYLSRWENGHRLPEQETLDRLAEVLECHWTDFIAAGREALDGEPVA